MGDDASAAKRARQDPATWWAKYKQLEAYVAEHERLPTQTEIIGGGFKVGNWINNQRQAKKGGQITAERIQALETLPGWYWGQDLDSAWREKFDKLKAYVTEHGRLPIQTESIGSWANAQRQAKKGKGGCRIAAEQIQALETLPGWYWEQDLDAVWREKFGKLEAFVVEHGRIPVQTEIVGDFKVGNWVSVQRQAKKGKGGWRITAEQIQALETLPGWYWEQDLGAVWREKFGKLEAYVAERRRLPTCTETIGGFKVGIWMNTQRQAKKGNKGWITAEQIQALETLPGWRWEQGPDAVWREKFGKLEAYVAEHGRLPARDESIGDFRVGIWMNNQRQAKKGGRITAEQIQALETIPGWRW
jgi:hypothetical protein